MEMAFTGERYVPTVQESPMRYEHLHRYALALDFVRRGKSVLDMASGEGYGSAYLSQVANSVIGVDIDRECINFSRQKYGNISNLEFIVGSCDAIPLSSESLDIVTSFETIEHHDKHDEMMRKIKRVLKPGGVLVISALPNNLPSTISSYTSKKDGLTREFCSLQEPIYLVAVGSDEINNTQKLLDSIFIDDQDDVLIEVEKDTQAQLNQWNSNLELKDIRCSELQSELAQLQALLSNFQSQLHQTEVILMQ